MRQIRIALPDPLSLKSALTSINISELLFDTSDIRKVDKHTQSNQIT